MSLVSTASDSSSRSCLHSAATSAVLPEPTGPPMPMRSGSPGVALALGAIGVTVWLAVEEMRWHGELLFQEANRGRSRWLCRWASTSSSGSDRSASSLQASAAVALAQRRQLERQRRDVARVEGEQPLRGGRRTGHRRVDDRQRRLFGLQAAGRAHRACRHREVRSRRRALSQSRPARLAAPAGAGRGPARGTPGARREPVCGRRFRGPPADRTGCRCARRRRPTRSPSRWCGSAGAGMPAASRGRGPGPR